MSIFNANQRAVIKAQTGIDPLIVDRVTEAYDALLADNIERYKHLMMTAQAQTGLPLPIPKHERPTAVDVVKTFCIRRISDLRGWTFKRTAKYLAEALERQT